MKKLILFLLIVILPLSSSSIDRKIKIKTRQLRSKKIEYNKMDRKLSEIAKKIIEAKREESELDRKLEILEKNIIKHQAKFDELNKKKKDLDIKLSNLSREIEDKREEFISLVSDKFSISLVLEELHKPTKESVILQEAYGVYAENNKKEIRRLQKEIEILRAKEDGYVEELNRTKVSIAKYEKEQREYQEKKDRKMEIIESLAREKQRYKKRFDKIRASKRALQKKLAELKIIKQEEEIKNINRTASKRRTKKKRNRTTKKRVKTATYRGKKTISPIRGAKLIKKFGTYIDPIYKFKIFNKSITLKAPYRGAKVKSVLSGKIVFAENSGGMLGKVVIVSHPNNMHTIYAKLSRLAPGIHVGKRVSKGTIIGKVNKSLMFEVTKNNKHMNPLKLIQL